MALTVRVTGTMIVLFVLFRLIIRKFASVYVPGLSIAGMVGLAVTVNVCGVVPDKTADDGLTVSHVCDGTSATDVLPPVAETVMLCDTAEPPASAEKVNDAELTDIVWALAAPAASSTREIKGEFNVFKENLHRMGISGADRASPYRSTPYATAHCLTKIMNRLDCMSRPGMKLLV